MKPLLCPKKNFAKEQIDSAIRGAFDLLAGDHGRTGALARLLSRFHAETRHLSPVHSTKRGNANALFVIRWLAALAAHYSQWIRPLCEWQPTSRPVREELRALTAHLLAKFPTPHFMDIVWHEPYGGEAALQQSWFIAIARGSSFRSLELPIPLTQKMEHFARQAPDHFKIFEALRFGEILALGGTPELAKAISKTRLGRKAENALFWRTVIQFLASHPDFPLSRIFDLVELIQLFKFGSEQIRTPNGIETRPPFWPDFRIEGRTTSSLLRLIKESHVNPNHTNTLSNDWKPSIHSPFRYVQPRNDGSVLEWSIIELLNTGALQAEGRALRHCVAIYDYDCEAGESSIWSLRLRIGAKEKRMATIEVLRDGRIVQVKAKLNARPNPCAVKVIRHWAKRERLRCEF
jgi:hypothetical protein